MKKMFLMTILVCVISSLGCQAEVIFEQNNIIFKASGDTAAIIGWRYTTNASGQSISPYTIELDSVCEDEQGNKYIITSVEYYGSNDYVPGLRSLIQTRKIILPSTVKHIGANSIYNGNFHTIKMPGVKTIGERGLYYNINLTYPLELRELESVGIGAFESCSKLSEVRFGEKLRFIGKNAFVKCKALKIVDIGNPQTWSKVQFEQRNSNPITITKCFSVYGKEVSHVDMDLSNGSVSQWAYANAENLRSVRIRNAVRIDSWAFDGCSNLTDLCLDTRTLGDSAFSNITTLRRIYVTRQKPPRAYSNVFSNYENVTLYVPEGSLEAYRNSDYCWRLFKDIQESDFSDIDDIFKADYDTENPASVEGIESEEREEGNAIDPTKPLEVYTMQGQLISRSTEGLTPGLYILRQGRRAKKILIGHH